MLVLNHRHNCRNNIKIWTRTLTLLNSIPSLVSFLFSKRRDATNGHVLGNSHSSLGSSGIVGNDCSRSDRNGSGRFCCRRRLRFHGQSGFCHFCCSKPDCHCGRYDGCWHLRCPGCNRRGNCHCHCNWFYCDGNRRPTGIGQPGKPKHGAPNKSASKSRPIAAAATCLWTGANHVGKGIRRYCVCWNSAYPLSC